MRILFLLVFLLSLAGCSTLREMNSNMQRSNALMEENIVVMTDSKVSIEANTAQVTRSTDTMENFERVIDSNTETINKVFNSVETHSYFLPMVFIAILVLLFLPSVIMAIFYYKFLGMMKAMKK